MAFKLGQVNSDLPKRVDNLYVVPYTWLNYGISQGGISFADPDLFLKSKQGAIYTFLDYLRSKGKLDTQDKTIFGLCKAGSNQVDVVSLDPQSATILIEGEDRRGILLESMEHILSQDLYLQMEYNRMYIRCFKGGTLTLVKEVFLS